MVPDRERAAHPRPRVPDVRPRAHLDRGAVGGDLPRRDLGVGRVLPATARRDLTDAYA